MNQTFRTPLDAPTWEWFTSGNPYGASRVYLAQDSTQLAGVYSFTPVRIKVEGKPVTARHGHHLAIRPAYRGGAAFIALSRYALSVEESHGTELIIGLLNRKSYGPQKVLMKWADFGFLETLYKLSPQPHDHGCKEARSFPGNFDLFYSRISQRMSLECDKTTEWMNWRFRDRPGSPYRIYTVEKNSDLEGYVILKRWQDPDGYRKAHIIDLHATNEEALEQLLSAAETYASDCDELNLWAIQQYPYRAFLERSGFSPRGSDPQPLAIRAFGPPLSFPEGPASFSYGDGDTVF